MNTDKRLARYITGQNAVADYAKANLTNLLPQLHKYVGKKIFTTDGSKAKLFVVDMGKLVPTSSTLDGDKMHDAGSYLHYKYGKLCLHQRICIVGDFDKNKVNTYCQYFDRDIELGKVENQVLTSVNNIDEVLKNYGFDKPIILQDEINKLAKLKTVMEQATAIKDTLRVDREFYRYF